MRALLDTHLLLWAAGAPERLPLVAAEIIEDENNGLVFSAASLWEVATKAALGRTGFTVDSGLLRRGLVENGYAELPITGAHACRVASLPPLHRDPFDRMLVAQAMVEELCLLTADPVLTGYAGPVMVV